ncbi:uncharacterized protein LOC109611240 [Ooceraea biroi]|uniref:uncharacterized protein LOC109611240 n=1 Tax=Ooceraea biroi TaxID=2015173 RepID=UPI0009715A83|nr:uncharacterized protein LOC109611240 [Ooceraea biroi]
MKPINADSCVYCDESKSTLALAYVDDIIFASRNDTNIKRLKEELAKRFTIKDLGNARYCLGIEIDRDRKGIHLSQSGYIRDVLKKFGMSDCKPVRTPFETGIKLHDNNDLDADNAQVSYRELIGSLMYLAQGTRPDIAHAVSSLSQWNTSFKKIHWTCAKRVLRYLKGTINHGLHYTKSGKNLIGYTDADWGSCSLDRRSYTGSVFLLANAAISWESRKQKTVALSSTEAEYAALSDAAREAIHLSRLLSEIDSPTLSKITLHNDNQAAAKLAVNPVFHSRSKHIDIKCHFIRQALVDHRMDLVYTCTEDMIADVLTKALSSEKHAFCFNGMGIKDINVTRV